MATSTVEQYLKIIFQEERLGSGNMVQMKRLAEAMGVTPGTATTMVKYLDAHGYIRYVPRKGVELRESGRRLALSIVRRHRLIETFLEQVLGYDWAEVHEEAEQLEHAVSDLFIERLDEHLGYPSSDPHGDPIPTAEGSIDATPTCRLTETIEGSTVEITRLREDSRAFLDMMKRYQLLPGETVEIATVDPVAGIVTVTNQSRGTACTMGFETARHVLVSSGRGHEIG